MKYAIFSDIHGNYEALKVVLAKMKSMKVDRYFFCGDLVGYGAESEKCAQALMKLDNFKGIMGNHDLSLLDSNMFSWFSSAAISSIMYAKKHFSPKSLEFVSNFKTIHISKTFWAVHGSFTDPFREYLLSPEQFEVNRDKWSGNLCFLGHTHMPLMIVSKPSKFPEVHMIEGDDTTIKLNKTARYMINPGSVGQPRDHNSKASFGIYDSIKNTFRLIRVKYPVASTQEKILKSGLPRILADRLSEGM